MTSIIGALPVMVGVKLLKYCSSQMGLGWGIIRTGHKPFMDG